MKIITISNLTHPMNFVHAVYSDTFLSKLLGLMFRKDLPTDRGVILVDSSESKLNSSIHMLFMKFDIAAIWLTKDLVVCDFVLAKKWHLAYFPKSPAQYVLELHTQQIHNFNIGDQLHFENEI